MSDKDKARNAHKAHADNRNELALAAKVTAEHEAHEAEVKRHWDERHQRRMQAVMPVEDRPLIDEWGTRVAY